LRIHIRRPDLPAAATNTAIKQTGTGAMAAGCAQPLSPLRCADRVERIATYHFPALNIQKNKTRIVAVALTSG